MGKLLHAKDVDRFIRDTGYTPLSEYASSSDHISVKCNNGHVSNISWNNFKRGKRCGLCHGTPKLTIEYIRSKFNEYGFSLFTEYYVNNTQKLKYRCPDGHGGEISWTKFQQGRRCKECKRIKLNSLNTLKGDEAQTRELFRKKCYGLLSRSLEHANSEKRNNTHKSLGYTPGELRNHIENHPNWVNLTGEWHLDHIFPIKAFIDHGVYDIKLINSLDNLQPLNSLDNLIKSSSYDKVSFNEWLETRR